MNPINTVSDQPSPASPGSPKVATQKMMSPKMQTHLPGREIGMKEVPRVGKDLVSGRTVSS